LPFILLAEQEKLLRYC